MTHVQAKTRSRLVPHYGAEKGRKSVDLVEAELVVYCIEGGSVQSGMLETVWSGQRTVIHTVARKFNDTLTAIGIAWSGVGEQFSRSGVSDANLV
jgi:hypothetical protein